jgi:hypothetical protein
MSSVTQANPAPHRLPANIREQNRIFTAAFTVTAPKHIDVERILRLDAYSAAMAYIHGQFSIEGDLSAAIRYFLSRPTGILRRLQQTVLTRYCRPSRFLGSHERCYRAASVVSL